MLFQERLATGVVLFDGAMGTQIQGLRLDASAWQGQEGCSEILNLTIPDKIQGIHEAYLAAGADVVETNTFGANRIVLEEYGLRDRVKEINIRAAELARRAVDRYSSLKPRYIAGSMGPGTKLISLGQTDFDTMYNSYFQQAEGLLAGGVDLFMLETCQDPLQIKTALIAVREAQEAAGTDLPVIISVTVETTGTLLVGSEVSAVLAIMAPFSPLVLGINCATGPEEMHTYIRQICAEFPGYVICQPNAGLPRNVDGKLTYSYDPHRFCRILSDFVKKDGVNIVGGCCGTTPEFIRLLAEELEGVRPAARTPDFKDSLASLFSAQSLHQDPPPFFVGERTNTNGSKAFRTRLLENDWEGILEIAREQERTGAHGLDLCVAYTGRPEKEDMSRAVMDAVKMVQLPLFIDSTSTEVLEAALKLYGGRGVINSINLENGEERVHQVCALAKRFGTGLIALTIDEKGMAMDSERKLAVAGRLYKLAVEDHGLRPQDLIFDALTFTLGSGDVNLKTAGINTLEGIRRIKAAFPGVLTILGLSNISFGLAAKSRVYLNSVFLAEALEAGLDMAIVDVKKILPLYKIEPAEQEKCLDLIYNRTDNALFDFIAHFDKISGKQAETEVEEDTLSLEEKIRNRVIQGRSREMEPLLKQALEDRSALEIINTLLIPAMKKVGELFGAGKMQLPFVLQAAEVMKASVTILEPFMDRIESTKQTSIVLATVRGDVHDIGKNLVDIILSNNGYRVYNIGIKCEIATMLTKINEVGADALGMSGLLVKSSEVMRENLTEMKARGIQIPVLLGGAALTRSFVNESCAPLLDAPVVYCKDAFAGLEMMNRIKEGELAPEPAPAGEKTADAITMATGEPEKQLVISRDIAIPTPPFWGRKEIRNIELDEVFALITEQVLFRGRWGYRRGTKSREEYSRQIEQEVYPLYAELKRQCKKEGLFTPLLVYGYWPCNSQGNEVIVFHPESGQEYLRFHFPRQKQPPYQCIADFFLPLESGKKDIIACQVVTIGPQATTRAKELYARDAYKDYLLFHGLGVETAEALAEYAHRLIRRELNIMDEDGKGIEDYITQQYRGSRYSFGYPACPDLEENRKLFQLLNPEKIGVTLTPEDQMEPEQSTSAFIVHHPQAKYFKA